MASMLLLHPFVVCFRLYTTSQYPRLVFLFGSVLVSTVWTIALRYCFLSVDLVYNQRCIFDVQSLIVRSCMLVA